MFWLKYKHGFASHTSAWEWKPIFENNLEKAKFEAKEELIPSLEEEYSFSDKYRGIKWEVVGQAPYDIVKGLYDAACHELEWVDTKKRLFREELGRSTKCPQCTDAKFDDKHEWRAGKVKDIDWTKRPRPCPTCGRENVFPDSMPYYLPLHYETAFKLLKLLVIEGKQTENPDWPVGYNKEDEGGYSPIQVLLDLGLVGGSCGGGSRKTVWEATELGKREVDRRAK